MDPRQRLRAEIDQAAEDMVHKIQSLEEQAGEIEKRVRDSVSLQHQFERRPWVFFGLAFATGLLIGSKTG